MSVYLTIAASMLFVAWSSHLVIGYVATLMGFGGIGTSRFSTFDSFPIYILSVCLLCVSIRKDSKVTGSFTKRVILFFSGSTAGIYMMHEHPLVRNLLWKKIGMEDSSIWIVLVATILIFGLSALIDNIIWKPISTLVGRMNTEKLDNKITNLY